MKISIITPSLNQGRFIEDTILSVQNQDYDNVEHIVMDGGSTDGTVDILKKYSHLKWISEPDSGQTNAGNKAIKISAGDIIGWLNSDDLYFENIFSEIASIFEINPQVSAIYGDYHWIDEDGNYIKKVRELSFSARRLLYFNCIPHPTVFLRKDVFDKVGLFREDFECSMDYEFWLRLHQKCEIIHVPMFIAKARFHSCSKSFLSKKEHKEYQKVIIQIHGDLYERIRKSHTMWFINKLYYRLLKEWLEFYNNPVYFMKKVLFNALSFLSRGRVKLDYRYRLYY